jgi:hypothetical protein
MKKVWAHVARVAANLAEEARSVEEKDVGALELIFIKSRVCSSEDPVRAMSLAGGSIEQLAARR